MNEKQDQINLRWKLFVLGVIDPTTRDEEIKNILVSMELEIKENTRKQIVEEYKKIMDEDEGSGGYLGDAVLTEYYKFHPKNQES